MSESLRAGAAVIAASLLLSSAALADVIKIRADEWLPYNGGSDMKPPGYMIEMAQRIAERNGHTIQYRHMPWEDALDGTRRGSFDCVVGAYKSDVEGFALPPRGWGYGDNTFFGFADNPWRYKGIASLEGVRVGVLEGYSYGEELDAYIAQHKDDPSRVIVVPVVGRAIVKLIANLVSRRIDVFIEDSNVTAYGLTRARVEEGRIVALGQASEAEEVYIACTPADPRGQRYVQMFDAGLTQLRASGELEQILAKYGLKDWEQQAR
jgi:polar amino acid transport system substrate-binding protein